MVGGGGSWLGWLWVMVGGWWIMVGLWWIIRDAPRRGAARRGARSYRAEPGVSGHAGPRRAAPAPGLAWLTLAWGGSGGGVRMGLGTYVVRCCGGAWRGGAWRGWSSQVCHALGADVHGLGADVMGLLRFFCDHC